MAAKLKDVVPSQTKRGAAWLSNFSAADRPAAQVLVDSLHVSSADEVRSGIVRLLETHVDGPSALVPVRSMEDLGLPHVLLKPLAFTDFDPGGLIHATPGSEGFIGNLIRDLAGDRVSPTGTWIHPSATLTQLKERKCRTIALVTDYIGSGTQVSRFAATFLRHRTIRSWRSFGWLKVVVVAYATSQEAIDAVDDRVDAVWSAQPARSFRTAGWSARTRSEIEDLCLRYAGPKGKGDALGFGGSRGLYLSTVSSVPNNIPTVLRRTGGSWHEFFQGRVLPTDLRDALGGYQPPRDLADLVANLGNQRLAVAMREARHGVGARQVLTLLAFVYGQPGMATDKLAFAVGLSFARTEAVVRYLRKGGLITHDNRITEAGLRELRASRRLRRGVPEITETPEVPYYPHQLR